MNFKKFVLEIVHVIILLIKFVDFDVDNVLIDQKSVLLCTFL